MSSPRPKREIPPKISRRNALGAALAAGAGAMLPLAGLPAGASAAEVALRPPAALLDPEVAKYLARPSGTRDYFQNRGPDQRGKTAPWERTPKELAAAGLDAWTLEVTTDARSQNLLKEQRTKATHNAITYVDLLRMANQRPVRILKSLVCLGMPSMAAYGLYEGVALRDVLWLAKPNPKGVIRRIAMHAFDPKDPAKQQWCSTLPPARVFEDPIGMAPVMLCLKFNGDWLAHGGPVRVIVHEHYGFMNVKDVRRIMLTNDNTETDNYAKSGRDVNSPMKSFAEKPAVVSKQPLMFGGRAWAGMSGLKLVQYAVAPADTKTTDDDVYLQWLPWKDGVILPAPANFASLIPGGPKNVFGLSEDGTPLQWPIPSFLAYWVSPPVRDLKPGRYRLFCRAVNNYGDAQPMPRPYGPHEGVSDLQSTDFEFTGS